MSAPGLLDADSAPPAAPDSDIDAEILDRLRDGQWPLQIAAELDVPVSYVLSVAGASQGRS